MREQVLQLIKLQNIWVNKHFLHYSLKDKQKFGFFVFIFLFSSISQA